MGSRLREKTKKKKKKRYQGLLLLVRQGAALKNGGRLLDFQRTYHQFCRAVVLSSGKLSSVEIT